MSRHSRPSAQRSRAIAAWMAFSITALAAGWPARAPAIERVNLQSDGTQSTQTSAAPTISQDGRMVAFFSSKSLAAPCLGQPAQIDVRDRTLGTITCVSLGNDGQPATSVNIVGARISRDGRTVAFVSGSNALTAACSAQPNGVQQVYVRDLVAGTTECISVTADGTSGANNATSSPALSADGRLVAFGSDALNLPCGQGHILLRDRTAGTTTCITAGAANANFSLSSGRPVLTDDGQVVAFHSNADNLDPACAGGGSHIYRLDRQGAITCVAALDLNFPDFTLSADGRFLAFASSRTDLAAPCTNGEVQVYVYDSVTATRSCVSVAGGGPGNAASAGPSLSDEGHLVSFSSAATNLALPCTTGGLFTHDRTAGTTTCVSVNAAGQPANGASNDGQLTGDGRLIVFGSFGANLVPGDTNNQRDVFVGPTSALPHLGVALDDTVFTPGETLTLRATLVPGLSAAPVDAYVALRLPSGAFLSLQLGGLLVPGLVPIASGLVPFSFVGSLLDYTLTGVEPPGDYAWLAGLAQPGTLSVLGTVQETPFSITP